MRILIFGPKSWTAQMLWKELEKQGHQVEGCHHDINSLVKIDDSIDVVINCAASTNIDWVEQNKNRTFWNNVLGAVSVAKVCKQSNKRYVFISSACIFESQDMDDWKDEYSKPNPQCFYAETKVMAEKLIKEISPETLIIRIRLPLSEVPHPRNTINKLLTYKTLQTNQESVTVMEDAIPEIIKLIEQGFVGQVHLINSGTISPDEIGDLFNHPHEKVSKATMDVRMEIGNKARRVTTYARSARVQPLPDIRERIKSVVARYKEYAKSAN